MPRLLCERGFLLLIILLLFALDRLSCRLQLDAEHFKG